MIHVYDRTFVLETAHTTYAMRVIPSGPVEHLYYGTLVSDPERMFVTGCDGESDCRFIASGSGTEDEAPGNTIVYDPSEPALTLEALPQEMSGSGKGDIREPFIELTAKDGSFTTDFIYDSHKVTDGTVVSSELPSAHETGDEVQTLMLRLKDRNHGYVLELYYQVFTACDVITRRAFFYNDTDSMVQLRRLMSAQLELPGSGYHVTTFTGHWTKEMNRNVTPVTAGTFAISSVSGSSGNRANPFFMVSDSDADEDRGNVYACNLVYSGNHRESVSVSGLGDTRVIWGINPDLFMYTLAPGERFETPEAVMTYSPDGFSVVSRHMHAFVRNHIVPPAWRDADRPILLNSWEANYFDIDEERLVAQAKRGAELGIELFVMDDGWFGRRDDDTSSLGDWTVNRDKIPGGLASLCQRINDFGMSFGIWVEPEMVSVNSDLYRAHPDWVLGIPGMTHAEGRNQRILDLTNPAVVDHMIGVMTDVFSQANISYVKWDMNRIFSDTYSPYLGKERQGETAHRYILGYYRILRTLTEQFPDILFEGCAAGGSRFDLGVLCFCPQIWGSDNTDALCRLVIQNGYSFGYPQECCTSHVSAVPNHQTGRSVPLSSRFSVAAFGNLGYELDLTALTEEECDEIREQIAWYKDHRSILQHGQFRRMAYPGEDEEYRWEITGSEKEITISMDANPITIELHKNL